MKFDTEKEVIELMNDNQYGLSSGVYTSDLARGMRVSNACLLYTSDAADEEDSVDLGGRRIIKNSYRTFST